LTYDCGCSAYSPDECEDVEDCWDCDNIECKIHPRHEQFHGTFTI